MPDLGAIGDDSLGGSGSGGWLGGGVSVENSIPDSELTVGAGGMENSLGGDGSGVVFAGKSLSYSSGSGAVLGISESGGSIISVSISSGGSKGTGSLLGSGLSNSGASAQTRGTASGTGSTGGLSSAAATIAYLSVGTMAGESISLSSSSAALSSTAPPAMTIYHRVSPWQPITARQDFAGGKFWQRRVSGIQSRVRQR
jgi:hypothetical protein